MTGSETSISVFADESLGTLGAETLLGVDGVSPDETATINAVNQHLTHPPGNQTCTTVTPTGKCNIFSTSFSISFLLKS